MSVKITALQAENVKRIKAVQIEPAPTGLTIVGGNNNQGKTSVLDAIAWALGGEKYRPNAAAREGAVSPPHLKVALSNGIVVERKGKNGSLTVTDPTGKRAGQTLLNEFVEQLALDLPRFLNASDRDKADTLLRLWQRPRRSGRCSMPAAAARWAAPRSMRWNQAPAPCRWGGMIAASASSSST